MYTFQILGSGFEVITVGKKKLVRSVPTELNKDHNAILELAQVIISYCVLRYFCVFFRDGFSRQLNVFVKQFWSCVEYVGRNIRMHENVWACLLLCFMKIIWDELFDSGIHVTHIVLTGYRKLYLLATIWNIPYVIQIVYCYYN